MKTVLEYLNEQKDMAWHNRFCYSHTYAMDTPRKGMENQFAQAVRDCEIVDELIRIVAAQEKRDAKTVNVTVKGCWSAEDIERFYQNVVNEYCNTSK